MKSRLIAAVTAVAIAFTSATAAPAFADSRTDKQVLTLLLGAAALGLILNESKKKKERRAATVSRDISPFLPPVGRDRDRRWDRDRYRDHDWDRRRGHNDRRHRLLPARCAYELKNYNGRSRVVSRQCLADYGMHRGLPRECAFEAKGKRGWGTVYGARCLHRNGYKIANIQF